MNVIESGDPRLIYFEPRHTRVWSRSIDGARPVFHRRAEWPHTKCGLVVVEVIHDRSYYSGRGVWFPLAHALLFCRPCRRCWP